MWYDKGFDRAKNCTASLHFICNTVGRRFNVKSWLNVHMKQNVTKKRTFFASENPDITVSLAKYSYDKIFWDSRVNFRQNKAKFPTFLGLFRGLWLKLKTPHVRRNMRNFVRITKIPTITHNYPQSPTMPQNDPRPLPDGGRDRGVALHKGRGLKT